MISSSLMDLLLNKYVLGTLGGLIAILYAYIKGRSNANRDNELEKLEEERKLNARVRAAEAKNQFLEKKGEQINGKITSADTIDTLISLFNEIQSSKSSGSPSPKDPKRDH